MAFRFRPASQQLLGDKKRGHTASTRNRIGRRTFAARAEQRHALLFLIVGVADPEVLHDECITESVGDPVAGSLLLQRAGIQARDWDGKFDEWGDSESTGKWSEPLK